MMSLHAAKYGRLLQINTLNRKCMSRFHSSVSANGAFSLRNSLLAVDSEIANRSSFIGGSSLTWYSCGPTVYDSSHLGHARTYVCTDIIRRTMVDYFNIRMSYAMGITDIDDKIINKGRASGLHTWNDMQAMVRTLEDDFFRDMDNLNVLRPDTVLRVTEHIPEIISYIAKLIELKSAYIADDGVYFDFSSLKNEYDKFGSAHPGSEEEGGGAVEGAENNAFQSSAQLHSKRNAKDFALWKLHRGSRDDAPTGTSNQSALECVWDSPWGPGRPGWHIECSAMTHSVFGDHIDIHSGGVDLKFPHHTNEIAQCEAHNCSEHNGWVGTWLHLGHLHIEGRKMSKSLKNFVSISDYLRAGITANPSDDFRLYCLQHKYHAALTYSPSRVEEAAKFRLKMEGFSSSLRSALTLLRAPATAPATTASPALALSVSRKPTAESMRLRALLHHLQEEVHRALSDDVDTPRVLNCLSQLVGESTVYLQLLLAGTAHSAGQVLQPIEPLLAVGNFTHRILTIFGLLFPSKQPPPQILRGGSSGGHFSNNAEGKSSDGVAQQDAAGLGSDAIDAILQFRSQVRAAALVGMKALRAQKKTQPLSPLESQLEESYLQIMSHCDAGRDQLGAALGVKVEDMTGSASKWTRL